jgi:hypothetical protein
LSNKLPILVLLSLTLTACEVGHVRMPMTLGPSDTPPSCLTYSDTPAYGDCKGAGSVSVPQQAR